MTTKDEALKLALEALEKAELASRLIDHLGAKLGMSATELKLDKQTHFAHAITAIREALAERCVCGEPDTPGTHRTDGPCLAEQPAQQWTDETAKVPDHVWDEKCVLGHCGWPSGCADSERCRADNAPARQPPFLEPDYYVYNIDGQYRIADPQPTIRWGKK